MPADNATLISGSALLEKIDEYGTWGRKCIWSEARGFRSFHSLHYWMRFRLIAKGGNTNTHPPSSSCTDKICSVPSFVFFVTHAIGVFCSVVPSLFSSPLSNVMRLANQQSSRSCLDEELEGGCKEESECSGRQLDSAGITARRSGGGTASSGRCRLG